MHIVSVLHLLGFFLIFLAGSMLVPVPLSLYYGDSDYQALMISAAITLTCGVIVYKTTNFKNDLRAKEGFAVVTFGWLIFSFFGCLPFIINGSIPSFTDAFFETISGFTTTGATILTDIEALPHGLLLWRSLTHWIGGMGIIVMSLAILPFLGVGGMQLFKAEVPGPVADKLTPRITETAKILWGVYVLLTLLETILLIIGGMSVFDALCHAFGTMATGGYSTRNSSIAAYDSIYIDYVITFFMLVAGVNFSLHYRFLKGDWGCYWRNKEFRYFLIVIVAATTFISVDTYLHIYGNIMDSFRYSSFQVLTIMSTTGYGTADYEQWSYSSQFVLFTLMFIGGCAGSTSGGMKVMRIYLLTKFVASEIIRLIHPHAVVTVRLNNNVVPRSVVFNVLGFFVLFMMIFSISTFFLTVIGLDILTALGAVIACLGNIGPGLAEVGPTDNYANIPVVGKWLLCGLMLMGRLEVFTVMVLFSPSYWRK